MKANAYHNYLYQITGGDVSMIKQRLISDIMYDSNPQTFRLLAATGDDPYTKETFDKAANLVKSLVEGEELEFEEVKHDSAELDEITD